MSLGLILPRSAEERRKVLVCTVPGCGKRFPMDQDTQWARHVKACSTRNEDRMLAIVEHRDNNYFTASADPELFAHLRKGGN
jgi:hypothetical protein